MSEGLEDPVSIASGLAPPLAPGAASASRQPPGQRIGMAQAEACLGNEEREGSGTRSRRQAPFEHAGWRRQNSPRRIGTADRAARGYEQARRGDRASSASRRPSSATGDRLPRTPRARRETRPARTRASHRRVLSPAEAVARRRHRQGSATFCSRKTTAPAIVAQAEAGSVPGRGSRTTCGRSVPKRHGHPRRRRRPNSSARIVSAPENHRALWQR